MKSCYNCGFAKNNTKECALLKAPIMEPDLACPFYEKEPQFCFLCGNVILPHQGIYIPEFERYVCNSCGDIVYSCVTCRHSQQAPACLAAQYNGPLDIMITVTSRQGMFQVQTKQVNPAVIGQVCPTCKCGSPWNCQRLHKCDNWEAAK